MSRKIGSRYTVTRVIGRGTCGTVWEGAGPDGPVAVKLLREDLAADQTLIARFVQERTVLTSLTHPNVVAVRDLVVDGSDLALVMDLVRGSDLRERLETRRALRPAEAAALAGDVAAGLAAAHAQGVVHRDVKPENVLLDANTGVARLTDFGIARLVDGPRRTRATRIVGTPDYLAPEVIEGCPPGPPVDVYALGTLIFELLTGWTPFGGGHPGAVLRRHVTETVPEIVGMPEPLAELLDACLSKAPAARLTAAELCHRLRELEPLLEGLRALRIPDPRAVVDPAALAQAQGPAGPPGRPLTLGAIPLVRGAAGEEDDCRQTHMNLIRPIREPLGPSAPIPGASPKPRPQAVDGGSGGGGGFGRGGRSGRTGRRGTGQFPAPGPNGGSGGPQAVPQQGGSGAAKGAAGSAYVASGSVGPVRPGSGRGPRSAELDGAGQGAVDAGSGRRKGTRRGGAGDGASAESGSADLAAELNAMGLSGAAYDAAVAEAAALAAAAGAIPGPGDPGGPGEDALESGVRPGRGRRLDTLSRLAVRNAAQSSAALRDAAGRGIAVLREAGARAAGAVDQAAAQTPNSPLGQTQDTTTDPARDPSSEGSATVHPFSPAAEAGAADRVGTERVNGSGPLSSSDNASRGRSAAPTRLAGGPSSAAASTSSAARGSAEPGDPARSGSWPGAEAAAAAGQALVAAAFRGLPPEGSGVLRSGFDDGDVSAVLRVTRPAANVAASADAGASSGGVQTAATHGSAGSGASGGGDVPPSGAAPGSSADRLSRSGSSSRVVGVSGTAAGDRFTTRSAPANGASPTPRIASFARPVATAPDGPCGGFDRRERPARTARRPGAPRPRRPGGSPGRPGRRGGRPPPDLLRTG